MADEFHRNDGIGNPDRVPGTRTGGGVYDGTVDEAMSTTSTNPVQNKVITNALTLKSDSFHTHNKSDIWDFPTSLPASDVYSWAKSETKPQYTAIEVGAMPNTTVIPSKLNELSDDETHRLVTDSKISEWNDKSNFSGNYTDLYNKPSKLSDFTNDVGFISYYTETDPTVPSWAKQEQKPTYTKEEIGLGNTENKSSETIRSEITKDNVVSALGYTPAKDEGSTLDWDSIENKPESFPPSSHTHTTVDIIDMPSIPTSLSDLSDDSTHRVVTDEQINNWNTKTGFSGDYNDLTNKPTNLSDFNNDKGFITGYTETDPTVPEWAKQDAKPSYSKDEIGLGNVDNKSSTEILSEMTQQNVIDALGYTPASEVTSVNWDNINNKPTSYPPSSHTHDDRYYTESEVDAKIAAIPSGGSSLPFIDVTQHGVSHDWSDQAPAINALINNATDSSNNVLYFPCGYYRLDTTIILKSNIKLIGDNATFIILGNRAIYGAGTVQGSGKDYYAENEYITSTDAVPVNIENITIKGFSFTIAGEKPAIYLRNVNHAYIEDIYSTGGGVWINTLYVVTDLSDGRNSAEVAGITSIDKVNNDIHITNLRAINPEWMTNPTNPDLPYNRGIFVEYGNKVFINDCYIEGQSQGMEFWGGNATCGHGADTTTNRYCSDIFVNNCTVNHCSGGAIWGAMVARMIVSNCTINHTVDVGIDFESCQDSIAQNCVVRNCRAGNLSIFSCCTNITFANIISKCDSTEYTSGGAVFHSHFILNNSGNQPFEQTILLDGCQFISQNGYVGEVVFGTCRNRIVRNCYFENSKLCNFPATWNHKNSEITNNKFYFNMNISGITIIQAFSEAARGLHSIKCNTIQIGDGEGNIATATNCVGIECAGKNCEGYFSVFNNFIYGVTNSIKFIQTGSSTLYAIVKDNITNRGFVTSGSVNLIKSGNTSIGGTSWDS